MDHGQTYRTSSVVDVLQRCAKKSPNRLAYRFIAEHEREEILTYGELDRLARVIGARLQLLEASGCPVLLVFPSGLDFVVALFGAMYAGAIVVPVSPPRGSASISRFAGIVDNAKPAAILTTSALLPRLATAAERFPSGWTCNTVGLESLREPGADYQPLNVFQGNATAALQYTSGSTSSPKGVRLTHANILHNLGMLKSAFALTEDDVCVSWLPYFHDMGLIGGILLPLYCGSPVTLMSPSRFLTRPMSWLETITRYRATLSAAPNFGYELCARRVESPRVKDLDLSSWRAAFCGAEPIRRATLDRFATTFAKCGFRRESFYPCYGLAESTLMVAGGPIGLPVTSVRVAAVPLSQGAVVDIDPDPDSSPAIDLVASGAVSDGVQVEIVDPQSRTRSPVGQVGEIWIAGGSVAHGYWNNREDTDLVFNGRLAETGAGPFLRTGDQGFMREGLLYVTGRLKDLIIIRGANHYPQDIEQTVFTSHEALCIDGAAAFSLEMDGEERLVVVQEVDRSWRGDVAEIEQVVQRNVADVHGVSVYVLVLVKQGSVPRTTSGKVQRYAARALFESDGLTVIAKRLSHANDMIAVDAWTDERRSQCENSNRASHATEGLSADIATKVIVGELARLLRISEASVDLQASFNSFALDSLKVFELRGAIAKRLNVEVDIALFFEYKTVDELGRLIAGESGKAASFVAPRASNVRPIPLAFTQERLWLLEQLELVGSAYHITGAVRLQGTLDRAILELAFGEIICRHESLRTRFAVVADNPVQLIDPPSRASIALEDLSHLAPIKREAAASQCARACAERPFDLKTGPLLRVVLLKLAPEEHRLVLTLHHLIADGWSMGLLIREIGVLYAAFAEGRSSPLPPLPVQYADYAIWQRQRLQGEVLAKQIDYWQQHLRGALAALELPIDRPRPAVQSYRGASVAVEISGSLSERLRALARQEGVTLFMVLLAAFQVVLARWSGRSDIVVGTPIAGRTQTELEGLIGFFINTLALRTDCSGDPSFKALLARVRKTCLGAYAHPDIPFGRLIEALQPPRDLSRQPIFQVLFALQNFPREPLQLSYLQVSHWELEEVTAKLDLSLYLQESPVGLRGHVEYATDLFEASTIERLIGHFKTLLAGILDAPARPLSSITMLTPAERRQLRAWNDTAANYPEGRCVHQLVSEQAARSPERSALVYEGETLTYRELEARANQLAHYLRHLGVGPDTLVGLCVDRSFEMVIALLAILKAGGAYLPLDPSYPSERLRYMLKDGNALVVLTQRNIEKVLPISAVPIVHLDALEDRLTHYPEIEPFNLTAPDSLCYVLYTSGSTGQPKGVMGTHRAVVNRLARDPLPAEGEEIYALKSTLNVIDVLWEIFMPLIRGQQLVIVSPEAGKDPRRLLSILERERITRIMMVPSLLRAVLDAAESLASVQLALNYVSSSGEALASELADRFRACLPAASLFNVYGTSEFFDATWFDTDQAPASPSIPIGSSTPNMQVHILDPELQALPCGVTGEIYVSGAGLARGYLYRAALTAERFLPSPFHEGERMYRTGDLGRRRADGTIEYLGRVDQQVKVRGFRVEPGEVEAALSAHPLVREAVITVPEDPSGDKRLVAYVVPHDSAKQNSDCKAIDPKSLRDHLKQTLPVYMLPNAFVTLDGLPLLPNGKVDRRALPVPDSSAVAHHAYEAPRGEVEEAVARIWRELLEIKRVGRNDNFFSLGGHSLLAARLISRIEMAFGLKIPLQAILSNQTVSELAQHLQRQEMFHPSRQKNIVRLRDGNLRPLFLLHEVSGTAFPYISLSQCLKKEIPVYALQFDNELTYEYLKDVTLEALAAKYVGIVRSIEPCGPYRLGGWCVGGLIAYEMAYQLTEDDQCVEFLGLIDTPNLQSQNMPNPQNGGSIGSQEELRALMLYLEFGLRIMNDAVRSLIEGAVDLENALSLCHARGLIPKEITPNFMRVRLATIFEMTNIANNYRPKPLPIPAQLYASREFTARDENLGWSATMSEYWNIYRFDATHHTLLAHPIVAQVAEKMSAGLENPMCGDVGKEAVAVGYEGGGA